ncbi:MAG TPA: DNA replication and repair protein RecF [Candidatus Mcinerneyibacteriales bacterium]|nr:DNA replication and repair protein RecF [Candidatus Mcinerneyibacteriales bacterium]
MSLQSLELHQFRNIKRGEMDVSPRFNIIEGPNGSGKSNVLEALYLFFNGKSFRKARGRDMIQWGEDWFRLVLRESGAAHERFLFYDREKNFKYGMEQQELGYSEFFMQVFPFLVSREVFNLFYFSSGEVRRFFDTYILFFYPPYRESLLRFNRVLQERNALLKSRSFSRKELEIWDEYFCRYGEEVTRARAQFITEINEALPATFQRLFPAVRDARIRHVPSFDEEEFFSSREEDRERGYTTVGPHRDRYTLSMKAKEMSTHASQGQMKSFVLSLLLTLLDLFNSRSAKKGILLMDDIFEELDHSRRKGLLEEIIRTESQVFFTMVEGKQPFGSGSRTFHVREGVITHASDL